jgi:effector-binding domain-containing protein
VDDPRAVEDALARAFLRLGAGPSYEIYRNNPANARPEALRTDLYLPIAR